MKYRSCFNKPCDRYEANTTDTTSSLKDLVTLAAKCGKLQTVLIAADGIGVMHEVLVEVWKLGLLQNILEDCICLWPIRLLSATVKTRLLRDVLLGARKLGILLQLLRAVLKESDMLADVVKVAAGIGMLKDVMKIVRELDYPLLVNESIKAGVLGALMETAVHSGGRISDNGGRQEADDSADELWDIVRIACQEGKAELAMKTIERKKLNTLLLLPDGQEARYGLRNLRICFLGMALRKGGAWATGLSGRVLKESSRLRVFDPYLDTAEQRLNIAKEICRWDMFDTCELKRKFKEMKTTEQDLMIAEATERWGKESDIRSMNMDTLLNNIKSLSDSLDFLYLESRASELSLSSVYFSVLGIAPFKSTLCWPIPICSGVIAGGGLFYASSLQDERDKIALLLFLLLLLRVCTSTELRLSGIGNSEHRKSVIKQITLRSGDIERNPGPFYFNNWLRDMYKFLVRKVHNIDKDVNIPWKKLNLPDPNNSKFKKDDAPNLFTEELLQASESLIPSTHTEEFQILRTYIESGQEPDTKHLERIENIRKILVKGQELVEDLRNLPPEDRANIRQQSATFQLQFFDNILAEQEETTLTDQAIQTECDNGEAEISTSREELVKPEAELVAAPSAEQPTVNNSDDELPSDLVDFLLEQDPRGLQDHSWADDVDLESLLAITADCDKIGVIVHRADNESGKSCYIEDGVSMKRYNLADDNRSGVFEESESTQLLKGPSKETTVHILDNVLGYLVETIQSLTGIASCNEQLSSNGTPEMVVDSVPPRLDTGSRKRRFSAGQSMGDDNAIKIRRC